MPQVLQCSNFLSHSLQMSKFFKPKKEFLPKVLPFPKVMDTRICALVQIGRRLRGKETLSDMNNISIKVPTLSLILNLKE